MEQLSTQNVHQLAGQTANVTFWIAEAVAAIMVLDQYPARFRQLRDAQVQWVEAHGTEVSDYCGHCGGACEFGRSTPAPPQRVPSAEIDAARDRVRRAARQYLLPLHRARLMEKDAIRLGCSEIGIRIDTEDFEL